MKIKKVMVTLTVTIVGGVATAIILAQPQASTSNVQKFFNEYFSQVTQASQRRALYQEDLTPNFRRTANNDDFSSYDTWWASVKNVDVDSVQSVNGNKFAFTVWLTFHMRDGGKMGPETVTYTLVCNRGLAASLRERLPTGCGADNLQIESRLQGGPF